jgi:hypothetical protein
MGVRGYLFGFPGDFVALKGVSNGDGFAVKNYKLLVEVYIDIEVIDFIFPFFVHFVLKGELNVTAVDFHLVDKEQRDFVL